MEGPPKKRNTPENRDKQADVYRMAPTAAQPEKMQNTSEKPLSYKDAKGILEKIGEELAAGGSRSDIEAGFDIGSLARGMDRPGIEGIDEAIKYLDTVIRSKSLLLSADTLRDPVINNQLEQQKAAREALFAERTKRLQKVNLPKNHGD